MQDKPLRRVEPLTGGNALDAQAYGNPSFRQQKRESARRFGWVWTDAAKNRLIAKVKAIFWPRLNQANTQAQFPKLKNEKPQTTRQSQPAVAATRPAKKQLLSEVQRVTTRLLRDWD